MLSYEELRKRIKSAYFTKDFYRIYTKDFEEAYFHNGSYENVKRTEFYNRDSAEYCNFLFEFHITLPKFIIRFYDGNNLVSTKTENFENEEYARQYFKPMENNFRIEIVRG